jgi:putative aldouronate transport system substrate-binding protein
MKRRILFVLLVSLILVGGAALATAAPVKVTLWSGIPGVGAEGIIKIQYGGTPIGKMVSAITGVDWTIDFTQAADYNTAFNLRLAADDWPEAINMSAGMSTSQMNQLAAAGVIKPLDSYYKNAKYPNINMIRPNVLKYWTMPDGHIYNFPSGVYQDENQPWGYWAAAVWSVRPEILDAVGMKTSDLATLDGVEKFLNAVKAKGLKNDKGLAVYGMSSGEQVSFAPIIMNTFGVDTAGQGFGLVNGKYVHFRDNPQTKAALLWLNKMWNNGLIDPEALSQKGETLREKMMNRRIAIMADWAWGYWATVTAGKTPVTETVLLPYPTVSGVAKSGVNVTYNPNGGGGILITKNAKNPEAIANYVNEVFKDFDPTMTNDQKWEHQLTLQLGNRGTMWDWDPKALKPYYVYQGDMLAAVGNYNKMLNVGFVLNPLIVQGNDSNYFTASLIDPLDWIFKMHKFYYNKPNVAAARPYDSLKMPTDGLWNKNNDILGRVDIEYWAKLISASAGSFNTVWTAYQNQLEQQGTWSKTRAEWETTAKAQIK